MKNLIVQLRSNFFPPPWEKIFVSEHKSSDFNKHIFLKYTNSIFLISKKIFLICLDIWYYLFLSHVFYSLSI